MNEMKIQDETQTTEVLTEPQTQIANPQTEISDENLKDLRREKTQIRVKRKPLPLDRSAYFDFAVLDPGYGNVKVAKVSLEEKKVYYFMTPSIISEIPEWQYETLSDIGQSASVFYKGKYYLAGLLATSYGFRKPTLIENFLEEYGIPVFALSFCKDVKKIFITLSISDWHKREKIAAILKELGFEEVIFVVQGLGIWLCAKAPSDAVVVDVGFNTVDVLIINDRKVVRELCFSIKEYGLISFLEKLTKDDPYLLAMKLEQGDPELTQKVKKYYFPWLEEQMQVRPEWRRFVKSGRIIGKFILGGGGARFFPIENPEGVFIVKDPELANVEGVAKYYLNEYLKAEKENQDSKAV
ncbi:MAG: ParM/StbA family protein [Nitrososphaeria archaeon]